MNYRYAAFLIGLTLLTTLIFIIFFRLGSYLSTPSLAPRPVDVVVILGGGYDNARAKRGLELYVQGYTSNLVVTGFNKDLITSKQCFLDARVQALLQGGVPVTALNFDLDSSNSWEEAAYTRSNMQAKGWRSVIIISDPPHMRRLKFVYDKQFKDSSQSYLLVSSNPQWWTENRWWTTEYGRRFVFTEILKNFYYFLKYKVFKDFAVNVLFIKSQAALFEMKFVGFINNT